MTLEQNLERRNAMLTSVISHLHQYLKETEGCDHSVNICFCGVRNTLDEFGTYCYALTGGEVGWQYLRFDIDTDDPKVKALQDASYEAEANNASFRNGTIND
jgi:hypothetical protein